MKQLVSVLSCCFIWIGVYSQNCTGSLGDNIFINGDFGAGPTNVLMQDPGIAPGFIYNPQVPPFDGEYVITQDIGDWDWYFDWLPVEETSNNSAGYMMVVNASFAPGLFYEQEVNGLCSNTLYEFSADIINVIPPGTNALKPNVSFLLDGQVEFTTGEIQEDGQWHSYGFTFTTGPNQTSVTLSLRNNAPGGIGNDLALDNISFRPCGPEAFILPEDVAFYCQDGAPFLLEATIIGDQYSSPAYQWQISTDQGVTWNDIPGETNATYLHTDFTSGFYYYRFLLANDQGNLSNVNCRVNSNTKIIEVLPNEYFVEDTICVGLSYDTGANSYTEPGVYVDSLISFYGCDSIQTLVLEVVPDPDISAFFDIQDPNCSNENDGSIEIVDIINVTGTFNVSLNGEDYSDQLNWTDLAAGNYEIMIADQYGCFYMDEVNLSEPEPLIIDLGPSLTIDLGDAVSINVQSNDSLVTLNWSPLGLVPCANCTDFELSPQESTWLILESLNEAGCLAIDSINIQVETSRKVFIPNVISPNGDGINDVFLIYGSIPNVLGIQSLQVFDRWGGLVYEQENILPNEEASGWNPRNTNHQNLTGTYVYIAEILFFDGIVKRYSGDFTLIP